LFLLSHELIKIIDRKIIESIFMNAVHDNSCACSLAGLLRIWKEHSVAARRFFPSVW
jgi:hypothetical protein